MNQRSPYLYNNEVSSPSYRQGPSMGYQSPETQNMSGNTIFSIFHAGFSRKFYTKTTF